MEYKHFRIGNEYFIVLIDSSGNIITRDSIALSEEKNYISNSFLNEYCMARFGCASLRLESHPVNLCIAMVGETVTCLHNNAAPITYRGRVIGKYLLEIVRNDDLSKAYRIYNIHAKSIEYTGFSHPLTVVPILDHNHKLWFHNGREYISWDYKDTTDSITIASKKNFNVALGPKADLRIFWNTQEVIKDEILGKLKNKNSPKISRVSKFDMAKK